MTATCGTCKYRGKPITRHGDEASNWENVDTGYFLCEQIKHQHADRKPTSVAFVQDGSDYYAALCVADEFGCNQWAPVVDAHQRKEK